jgi:hypothetical protein
MATRISIDVDLTPVNESGELLPGAMERLKAFKMIPRDIPNRNRPIVLRTPRIASESALESFTKHPVTKLSRNAGSISPSPWGEGRDEEGRKTNSAEILQWRERRVLIFHALRLGLRPQPRSENELLQTSVQFHRISRAVENRDDTDEVRLNGVIDAVAIKNFHFRFINGFARKGKSFRVLKDTAESCVDFGSKTITEPGLLFVIPKNGIFKLKPRLWLKDYFAGHARRCASLPLSSARTFSQVTPSSGWRRSRSARSSNRANISGGNSSLNSAWMSWTTSHCSSNAIRRNCSRISIALIPTIYSIHSPAQAGFSTSASMHPAPRRP